MFFFCTRKGEKRWKIHVVYFWEGCWSIGITYHDSGMLEVYESIFQRCRLWSGKSPVPKTCERLVASHSRGWRRVWSSILIGSCSKSKVHCSHHFTLAGEILSVVNRSLKQTSSTRIKHFQYAFSGMHGHGCFRWGWKVCLSRSPFWAMRQWDERTSHNDNSG